MRPKKDLNVTYMGHLHNAWYDTELADEHDIMTVLEQFKQFNNVAHHTLPLFFAIDYTARKYLVMTEAMQQIAGYHPREFLESGMEKLLDIYQKDDFKIYNQNIFASNLQFLKNTPQHLHNQLVFSYNFRFRRSDKKYAHGIQRGSYITSKETGLPLYSLGMVMDVTNLKTDNIIVQTIEKTDVANGIMHPQLLERNFYYPDQEEATFTKREISVLYCLAEGLSSKQIAGKLHIAENTVVNHKQNMLRKTNAKNTTELIVRAVRSHII